MKTLTKNTLAAPAAGSDAERLIALGRSADTCRYSDGQLDVLAGSRWVGFDSDYFRRWLCARYWEAHEAVPAAAEVATAIDTLAGLAEIATPAPAPRRFAA